MPTPIPKPISFLPSHSRSLSPLFFSSHLFLLLSLLLPSNLLLPSYLLFLLWTLLQLLLLIFSYAIISQSSLTFTAEPITGIELLSPLLLALFSFLLYPYPPLPSIFLLFSFTWLLAHLGLQLRRRRELSRQISLTYRHHHRPDPKP